MMVRAKSNPERTRSHAVSNSTLRSAASPAHGAVPRLVLRLCLPLPMPPSFTYTASTATTSPYNQQGVSPQYSWYYGRKMWSTDMSIDAIQRKASDAQGSLICIPNHATSTASGTPHVAENLPEQLHGEDQVAIDLVW